MFWHFEISALPRDGYQNTVGSGYETVQYNKNLHITNATRKKKK